MSRVTRDRLAGRSTGRPFGLKFAVASGDGDGVFAVPGIEYRDEIVAVLEFRNTAATANAIAGDHTANATVSGNGTVTVSGGSTLLPGHSVMVVYHDFDN